MTIKQQGGIFGRNPTFNSIEADSAEITGNANFTGGDVYFYEDTGTTPQMVWDSGDERLTIGSTISTQCPFSVSKTTVGVSNAIAFLRNTSAAGNGNGLVVDVSNTPTSYIADFRIGNSSKVRINSSGNIALASGNGIDFSATSGTGTSELFDDYEEGTWTPAGFNAGSTSITAGGSASYSGVYTKVGRFVNCRIDIDVDDAGTSASVGDLIYFSSGLPFTPDVSLVTGAGNAVIYNSIGSNALGMVQVSLSSNTVYMKVVQTSGIVNYGQPIRGNFCYSVGG